MIAALLFVVGARRLALRTFLVAVALAIVGALLDELFAETGSFGDDYLGAFVGVAVVLLVVATWVRYTRHRRRLEHWFDEPKPGLKRRVERD
ncbi:MAG: hypothetical protein HYV42_03490 [Candidatus Magasanikbacteria bacterium]|nr:hypothetical protein [Candidatus Magasanikbacteria bacterium]